MEPPPAATAITIRTALAHRAQFSTDRLNGCDPIHRQDVATRRCNNPAGRLAPNSPTSCHPSILPGPNALCRYFGRNLNGIDPFHSSFEADVLPDHVVTVALTGHLYAR